MTAVCRARGFLGKGAARSRAILTLDDSFSHEVVVHGLCHDFRHFHAVELDEGVAFAAAGLHVKGLDFNSASISNLIHMDHSSNFKNLGYISCCFCGNMGFIAALPSEQAISLTHRHAVGSVI